MASFEAWKAMKEEEAKKVAARKRLEQKNKKKMEEENAARKGEALQVLERASGLLLLNRSLTVT